jgi:hypothetical protein
MKSYSPWTLVLHQHFAAKPSTVNIRLPLGQSTLAGLLQENIAAYDEKLSEHHHRIRLHAQKGLCWLSNQNEELTVAVNQQLLPYSEQLVLEQDAQLQVGLLSFNIQYEGPALASQTVLSQDNRFSSTSAPPIATEQNIPTESNSTDMSWEELLNLNGDTKLQDVNPHKLQESVLLHGDAPLSPSQEHSSTPKNSTTSEPINTLLSEYWAVKQNRALLSQDDVMRHYSSAQNANHQHDDLNTLVNKTKHRTSLFDILGDHKEEMTAITSLDPHKNLDSYALFQTEDMEDVLDLFDEQSKHKQNKFSHNTIPVVTQREHHLLSLDSAISLAEEPVASNSTNLRKKDSP